MILGIDKNFEQVRLSQWFLFCMEMYYKMNKQ